MIVPARALVSAVIAASLCSGACRKQDAGSAAPSVDEQRYTFRAEVVKLPQPSHAHPQITLRHEAIPSFRDQSGAVVGMSSMVMPFDVAPTASLDGIRIGDKVEVVLVADWPKSTFRIERVRQLPLDTALDFGQPGPAPAPTPVR